MNIVVSHLTRMQPGYICVAGVCPATGQHIRPVLPGRLTRTFLRSNGGPFDIGSIASLGKTTLKGAPPEVEDHAFEPAGAAHMEYMDPGDFWGVLEEVALPSLRDIFGEDLSANGSGCTVDLARGSASLGCLRPPEHPRIEINGRDRIRLHLRDGEFDADLSVTDLRLYEADQRTPRRATVRDIEARLRAGVDVLLSLGLARPWQKPGDSAPRHWLQVNNIHLIDDPGWRA
jgi:hypothetical protein